MPSLRRSWLRTLAWAGVLPGVLLVATLGYMLGMQIFEGEARDFWQSFACFGGRAEVHSPTKRGASQLLRYDGFHLTLLLLKVVYRVTSGESSYSPMAFRISEEFT